MNEIQSWEKSYNDTTAQFETELYTVCFVGFETALSFQGAADQYIAALVEENRLLTAERDRMRDERDGLWQIAGSAVTEHQRDQRLLHGQED